MLNRTVWLIGGLAGLAIAYVDSRPHWDDAGLTAMSMLCAAALSGLICPARAWRWALAVGIWIPANALWRSRSVGSLAMFVVLLFPIVGVYVATGLRRLINQVA